MGKFPGATLVPTLKEVPQADGSVDLYIARDGYHAQFADDLLGSKPGNSKGLATELAPTGIRVNTISPGPVQSPGADTIREDLATAFGTDVDTLNAAVPIGRIGTAEDIAYLVSERVVRDRDKP